VGPGVPECPLKPTKPMDMALGFLELGDDFPVDFDFLPAPTCLRFWLRVGEYFYTAFLGAGTFDPTQVCFSAALRRVWTFPMQANRRQRMPVEVPGIRLVGRHFKGWSHVHAVPWVQHSKCAESKCRMTRVHCQSSPF